MSLGRALNIPIETLVDYYVEVENRSDHLMRIYETALTQGGSIEIIRKVAAKYLESQNEDSIELTEKLFHSITPIQDASIKISLYELIIVYSRSHGIMPFIAKGLYQKYLIERNNFSRLKGTYYSGKYILNYMNFLSQEQQPELYYKLGIHAFNLRLYHESIEHCKNVLKYDCENPHKVNALMILRDAFFKIGEYTESEFYSLQYKQFNYPHTRENIILMDALFSVMRGNDGHAIEQLSSLLENCSHDSAVLATNHLLQLYLKQGDLKGAKTLLSNCRINQSLIGGNPHVKAEYAEFLCFQGEYYLAAGNYEESITSMLDGAMCYFKLDDSAKEKECLSRVMQIQLEHNLPPHLTFEKLNNYYTNEKEAEG
jgi:tetratricopeptide (TPR) repeat protein